MTNGWNRRRARQFVQVEAGWLASLQVQRHSEVTTILEQLAASQRRTQAHFERQPVLRLVQRRAHAADGIAQEMNCWNTRQEPAFPEQPIGVQVPDDGLF